MSSAAKFLVNRWWVTAAWGLAGLGLAPCASAREVPDAQQELEIFARALDGSVRQVQRARLGGLLGAESSRGYHLKGYGAFFVLPPRLLPSRQRDAFLMMPGFQVSGELRFELHDDEPPPGRPASPGGGEALRREGQKKKDDSGLRAAVPEDDLRVLEEQAQLLQQEAARSRQEAERIMEEFLLEVRQRRPESGSHPLPASTPLPPTPPEPAEPPTAPLPPAPPPAPPWSIWFPSEDGREAVSPDMLLEDVRAAVTAVLERQRAPRAVRPDEYVAVAIDFLPGGFWVGGGRRPAKTLLIRVRKREMDERQAGKIQAEEFRRRVEYQEN